MAGSGRRRATAAGRRGAYSGTCSGRRCPRRTTTPSSLRRRRRRYGTALLACVALSRCRRPAATPTGVAETASRAPGPPFSASRGDGGEGAPDAHGVAWLLRTQSGQRRLVGSATQRRTLPQGLAPASSHSSGGRHVGPDAKAARRPATRLGKRRTALNGVLPKQRKSRVYVRTSLSIPLSLNRPGSFRLRLGTKTVHQGSERIAPSLVRLTTNSACACFSRESLKL